MPDIPLAYLISFRCYGTWLHGDDRGSIDRLRNQYSSRYIPTNGRWHSYNVRHLKHFPVNLDVAQCNSVEGAIRESCKFRNWTLRAVNVRSNHVHVVVSTTSAEASVPSAVTDGSSCEPPPTVAAGLVCAPRSVPSAVADGSVGSTTPPERVLNAFKANATRQMRQDGSWPHEHSPWSDGGSRRYIWTELGLERAMDYVLNSQGGPIPELDKPRRGRL
jgi:hypothetical protein